MEIKITNSKEQPLLYREVIEAEGFVDAVTPSNAEAKKIIADGIKCDEKVVAVNKIKTSFGSRKVRITAYKYKDEESMKKIEPKKKEKNAGTPKAKKEGKKE